jgi:hypothetical protein
MWPAIGELIHADLSQHLNGAVTTLGLGLVENAEGDIVQDVEMRKQGVVLEEEPNISIFRRHMDPLATYQLAIEQNPPFYRLLQACCHA